MLDWNPTQMLFANTFLILLQLACQAPLVQQQQQQRDWFQHAGLNAANKKQSLTWPLVTMYFNKVPSSWNPAFSSTRREAEFDTSTKASMRTTSKSWNPVERANFTAIVIIPWPQYFLAMQYPKVALQLSIIHGPFSKVIDPTALPSTQMAFSQGWGMATEFKYFKPWSWDS